MITCGRAKLIADLHGGFPFVRVPHAACQTSVCPDAVTCQFLHLNDDCISIRTHIEIRTQVAVDYFMRVGLGLGQTAHGEGTPEGEVGRKGISCERTFAAISTTADLEAKVKVPNFRFDGAPALLRLGRNQRTCACIRLRFWMRSSIARQAEHGGRRSCNAEATA